MGKLREKQYTIVYFGLLILVVVFQLFKATRGMGYADEHFYVTLGQDFANGSALFYDNWHVTQMISIFLAPLYNLYVWLFKTSDGIVLGFRVIYILFNTFISVVFYCYFKQYRIYAVITSLIYVIFVPFNIQALSYNTMSIMFWITSAIFYDYGINHKKIMFNTISGILFACSVMNTPYLAFAYFISLGYVIYLLISKKATIHNEKVKAYVYFSIGILLMLILFVSIVLSRASISELLKTIKYLIDPAHSSSILRLIVKDCYLIIKRMHVFILCQFILLFLSLIKSKKEKYLNAQIICCICALIYLFFDHNDIYHGGLNIVLLPFSILIINFLILFKPADKLLYGMMVFSMIHMFFLAISSNVGYRSFLNPLIVFVMCGILYLSTISYRNKKICIILIIFVIQLLINNLFIYGNNIFSFELNTKIEKGPLKGLYDSEENVEIYNNKLEDIYDINDLDFEYASLITYDTWMYLSLEKKWSVNSSYMNFWDKEDYFNCLEDYWDIHSDKLPTIVYLDNDRPLNIEENDRLIKKMTYYKSLNEGRIYIYISKNI